MPSILVPLDGSREAETVLAYVPLLARSLKADVHLLRVIPELYEGAPVLHDVVASYGVGDGMVSPSPPHAAPDTRIQQAEGDHLSALIELRAQGLAVELEVVIGHPAEQIVERARVLDACLIAMASHGYGGLRRWALGSVADKVLHVATTPVFVAHSSPVRPQVRPSLRRILVPIDRSPLARKALPLAAALAAANHAELVLLHVLELPPVVSATDPYFSSDLAQLYAPPSNEMRGLVASELQALAAPLRDAYGIGVCCKVLIGAVAPTIIDVVAERDIDLVVLASHGYSGLQRWALGSVADKLLHRCPRPLLVVRAGEVSDPTVERSMS